MVPKMFSDRSKRMTIMATRPMKFAEREAADARRMAAGKPRNIARRARRAWRNGETEKAKGLFKEYERIKGAALRNRSASSEG